MKSKQTMFRPSHRPVQAGLLTEAVTKAGSVKALAEALGRSQTMVSRWHREALPPHGVDLLLRYLGRDSFAEGVRTAAQVAQENARLGRNRANTYMEAEFGRDGAWPPSTMTATEAMTMGQDFGEAKAAMDRAWEEAERRVDAVEEYSDADRLGMIVAQMGNLDAAMDLYREERYRLGVLLEEITGTSEEPSDE